MTEEEHWSHGSANSNPSLEDYRVNVKLIKEGKTNGISLFFFKAGLFKTFEEKSLGSERNKGKLCVNHLSRFSTLIHQPVNKLYLANSFNPSLLDFWFISPELEAAWRGHGHWKAGLWSEIIKVRISLSPLFSCVVLRKSLNISEASVLSSVKTNKLTNKQS